MPEQAYDSPEKQQEYWGNLSGMEMPPPSFFTPTRLFPAHGSDWTPMNPAQMLPPRAQEHPEMTWDYVNTGPGLAAETDKKWLPDVPPVPSPEQYTGEEERRLMKTVHSVVDSPRTPRRSETSEDVEAISPSPRRVDGTDCEKSFSVPNTPMQVRGWVPETPSPLTYRARHPHMHHIHASLAAGGGLPPPMPIPAFGETTALWSGN
jgi:hypothetical protein